MRYSSHPSIALSCVFFVHGVRTTPPGLAAPFGSDDDGTPAATRCLATATSENGTTTGGAAVEGSGGIAVAPGGGDAEAEDDDSNLLARPRDAKRRIERQTVTRIMIENFKTTKKNEKLTEF